MQAPREFFEWFPKIKVTVAINDIGHLQRGSKDYVGVRNIRGILGYCIGVEFWESL